ncbi:MAG: carbohydrate ABC transporter permease [Chloroflexota bacterium]|nr:carbohydrate ABC transporter permease [Chloroflexota bacterium]
MRFVLERLAGKLLFYLTILVLLFIVIFPVYWLVTSSFKSQSEILAGEPTWFPSTFTWANYTQVWSDAPLVRYFRNSTIISLTSMSIAVLIATLAGYAFSRFRFPGRGLFGLSILSTQMFPGILFLLPYFLLFTTLQRTPAMERLGIKFIGTEAVGWNYVLMIFTYTTFILPFTIWLMRGFFDSIPFDLEEAAMVDGCTQFQAFYKVALPLALPGVATVAILAFLQGWNEVLFASILTNPQTRTVALGIRDYRTQTTIAWNLTLTAGVLVAAPVVVFFTGLQRQLVSGLTAGAVKG